MATENGPDLSGAAAAVEKLMDDTCVAAAVSDPEDWVLDADLNLVPPAGVDPVYDGKCKLKAMGDTGGAIGQEGGQQLGLDGYRLDLPLSSPRLAEGMTVTLSSSRRMPQVVGDVFAVRAIVGKTMAVQASYIVERRARVE